MFLNEIYRSQSEIIRHVKGQDLTKNQETNQEIDIHIQIVEFLETSQCIIFVQDVKINK